LPYTQTNFDPSSAIASLQQQVATLAAGFAAAIDENTKSYQLINTLMPFVETSVLLNQHVDAAEDAVAALVPFVQINAMLNQEIEWMDKTINTLLPFVEISQIWAGDAIAHERTLDYICTQFCDPEFLIYWSFLAWKKAIKADGQPALEWIKDEFNELINAYEQEYMRVNGGHSQIWFSQLQNKTPISGTPDSQSFYTPATTLINPSSQVPPMPAIPGASMGGTPMDQLRQRIEAQKSGNPNLGQDLQRAHVMQRQQMMPTQEVW
jgi:hypothetical protein